MSAPQTFKQGDRVAFAVYHKVGGKYDHHSWNPVNYAGVILNTDGEFAVVKCDDGRERTADLDRCKLLPITPPLQHPTPPPP